MSCLVRESEDCRKGFSTSSRRRTPLNRVIMFGHPSRYMDTTNTPTAPTENKRHLRIDRNRPTGSAEKVRYSMSILLDLLYDFSSYHSSLLGRLGVISLVRKGTNMTQNISSRYSWIHYFTTSSLGLNILIIELLGI